MCTKCNSTPCAPTCKTVHLHNCAGCTNTENADCIIYNGDRLSFEPITVKDGSARSLTSLLEQLALATSCCEREAKRVAFNVADGPTTYVVVEEDTTKILLLTQSDDGVDGVITYNITLPNDIAFANKKLIFKDIATPSSPSDASVEYNFNIQIQYDWDPVSTSNVFSTLADGTHRTLQLRFLQVTNTSWQWVIVP